MSNIQKQTVLKRRLLQFFLYILGFSKKKQVQLIMHIKKVIKNITHVTIELQAHDAEDNWEEKFYKLED